MARPGGEADKLGNRYEAAFAVKYALECLKNPGATLTVEDMDPERAVGSEFTFESNGVEVAHQVKRQNGTESRWTVSALDLLKVWQHAKQHVSQGRQFFFSSLTPCPTLRELADYARRTPDIDTFKQVLNKDLGGELARLSALDAFDSEDDVWLTLRGMWFKTTDEADVRHFNDMVASFLLGGNTGRACVLHIAEILLDHLGVRFERATLLDKLRAHGIVPITAHQQASSLERVRSLTASWHDLTRQTMLRPPIPRDAAGELVEHLDSSRVVLLVGSAGSGKSAVLHQAVETLERDSTVLAFRLDRYGAFTSTEELGKLLGFTGSPVTDLAVAAGGDNAVLVVDQLDAISLASGRLPENFDAVADLIREASTVPGVRVVLACRAFDVANDYRIKALLKSHDIKPVSVEPLTPSEVDDAVESLGLDPAGLSASQKGLLQNPLNLVLLASIAEEQGALTFQSSLALFDAYWDHKLRRCEARRQGVEFMDVIARVAGEMSSSQTLAVPASVLDAGQLTQHANVLVSEGVLVRDGNKVAFFHETFFDYAFARLWVRRSESLVVFLGQGEQELFRRAQVRQILQHLQEQEPQRFLHEVEELLMSDTVRFHIKDTVLGMLAALDSPSSETADVLLRVAASEQSFAKRLWTRFLRGPWFDRLRHDGVIDEWLDGDSTQRSLAVDLMMSGARVRNVEGVLDILSQRRADPDYPAWRRWITRFAPIQDDRRLFDLFLDAVCDGAFVGLEQDMWLATHELAEKQPTWAIEFLTAYLTTGEDPYALDARGGVARLMARDYHGSDLVQKAAKAEPLAFVTAMLPYMIGVVTRTGKPRRRDGEPILDEHFSYRYDLDGHDRELDDALLHGLASALAEVSGRAPEDARPLLESLADDPHDAAQFLLYRGLIAGGETFADWAAELLLQGTHRLLCGNVSNLSGTARQLVAAISPHVSDDLHQRLEDRFRDLLMPWETRPLDTARNERPRTRYRYAFDFLSALEEDRLSDRGKLRLEEYRRRFETREPRQSGGMTVGMIGSPIESDAAAKMSDNAWLGAMRKYNHDLTDYETFRGGSRELSRVLQEQVKKDPARFARLAGRMTADLNPAYGDAILMGLGEAEELPADADVVYDAVRSIAALRHSDNDRWLGQALRRYYKRVPLDLVELIRDRTLHAEDPTDDRPVFTRGDDDEDRAAKDLRLNGINTARGTLAEALGDLLVSDADGSRTEVVAPFLTQMAQDPVLSVRSCVAHTIAAAYKHARDEALEAFDVLMQSDDMLLASDHVDHLIVLVGYRDIDRVVPIIERMLRSQDGYVSEIGGQLAGFAGLEWEQPDLLQAARQGDARIRTGLAKFLAVRVDRTSHRALAVSTLTPLFEDQDESVREAAASVAPHLRERRLRPYASLLLALIASPAYRPATPQIFLTLEHAPDRVSDLELAAAQRFLDEFSDEAGDIRTGAAGDAHYVSELVVRGLAGSRDPEERSNLLDVLDKLLEIGVYGIGEAIASFERG